MNGSIHSRYSLFALGLILLFCAWSMAATLPQPSIDSKPNIAVINLRASNGISAAESELLSDRLRTEIFSTGKVNVMEREQMQEILKENALQQSGACSEEACLVEMGKFLGVQLVVVGTIGRLGNLNMVSIRVVDVQSAKTEMAVSKDIQGEIETVVGCLHDIALQLVEPIAKPKPLPAIIGKITIETQPAQATIRLNGKVIGRSPLIVDSLAPGSYAIEAEKEMYFAVATQVKIEKIETKNISFDLTQGAMLNIVAEPTGATIGINDSAYGKAPIKPLLLRQDSIVVRAAMEGYDDYNESVKLVRGGIKTLGIKLASKFGTLTVSTEPKGALCEISGLAKGSPTPCTVKFLTPGDYDLKCSLHGFEPVTDKVSVPKNSVVVKSYGLVHSRSWNDSVAAAKVAQDIRHRHTKHLCQIIFGALSIVSAGIGYFADTKVQSAYADYSGLREMNQSLHDSNWQAVQSWRQRRTISYSSAGVFAAAVGITFLF